MKNIKKYRSAKGMSKSELARLINVSPSYITKLENGEKKNPSLEVKIKMAKALGCSMNELINDKNSIKEFDIGEKIKFYRKNLKFTQQELADLAGISLRALSNYEKGTRIPPLEILIKLTKALDINVQDLDVDILGGFTREIKESINELKEFINNFQDDFLSISNRENIVYDKGFLDGLKTALEIIEGD